MLPSLGSVDGHSVQDVPHEDYSTRYYHSFAIRDGTSRTVNKQIKIRLESTETSLGFYYLDFGLWSWDSWTLISFL